MTVRFSASYAKQLMHCPGSANLDLAIPGWKEPEVDDTVGAKAKGHDLHKYLEEAGQLPAKDMQCLADALAYVAEVRGRRRFKVLAEHTFTAGWLQSKPKTTVDLVFYTSDELHVIDWKTGRIPVSPVDNEQLKFYTVCAIAEGLAPKAKYATLHIVQPWANNMDWVEVSAQDLNAFMQQAQAAEAKVLNKSTHLNPGDHCLFCPANPHSRGDKGRPLCPPMLQLLYPPKLDEDEILALD